MLFQVQFKFQTKTFNIDLESDSYSSILDLFFDISACEVTEIRLYKYLSNTFIKDDGNYINSVSFTLEGYKGSFTSKIPKIKKNLDDELFALFLNNLLFDNKKPKNVKFKFNMKYTMN